MDQNVQRLLYLAPCVATILLVLEPTISARQIAFAETDGNAARRLPAPMLRLMSEMPILRQLVTPSRPNPTPVLPPPAIGVSLASFSFSAQQGEINPPAQALMVTNKGGGVLSWNATANAAWLTLSPASGAGNGTVTLTADTRSLAAGSYIAVVTVNAVGAAAMPISVSLTVAPASPPPAISASPTSLSFTVQQGGSNPPIQIMNIGNSGAGTLSWTASDNVPWLTLSPPSGTNNGTMTVSTVPGSMAVGTYSGMITISATGAKSISVPVTLAVTSAPIPPAIGASPTILSFSAQQGGSNPAAQTLNISNTGGGTLTWTASESASWLTVSPASGNSNGTITVAAATGTLTAGTYNAIIALGATGASQRQVPVTFIVTSAPTSISLNRTSLTYSGVQGGATPISQSVNVTSNGNWAATNNAPWLTLSPSSGVGNGNFSVRVNLENASVGTNNAMITVIAGGTTKTIGVTLTVSAASLTVLPGSFAFTATEGAANPSPQTVTLSSAGAWTASDNAPWLSLSPTSGSKAGQIVASVNTVNIKPGTHSATISVTSGGVTRTANATLTLNAPSSSSATLTWNANKEKDLAGYKVYRATESGAYGAPIATVLGSVNTYQAKGLQFGKTYFFVVTAYDIAGNESAYSNEVSKSIF